MLVDSSANGGDPSEEGCRLGRCVKTCSSSGAGWCSSSSPPLSAPDAIFTVDVEAGESGKSMLDISVDQDSAFSCPDNLESVAERV